MISVLIQIISPQYRVSSINWLIFLGIRIPLDLIMALDRLQAGIQLRLDLSPALSKLELGLNEPKTSQTQTNPNWSSSLRVKYLLTLAWAWTLTIFDLSSSRVWKIWYELTKTTSFSIKSSSKLDSNLNLSLISLKQVELKHFWSKLELRQTQASLNSNLTLDTIFKEQTKQKPRLDS